MTNSSSNPPSLASKGDTEPTMPPSSSNIDNVVMVECDDSAVATTTTTITSIPAAADRNPADDGVHVDGMVSTTTTCVMASIETREGETNRNSSLTNSESSQPNLITVLNPPTSTASQTTLLLAPSEAVILPSMPDTTTPSASSSSALPHSSLQPPSSAAAAAAVPPSTPPFLFTSGPAYWDSIKSRLIQLATAFMMSTSLSSTSTSAPLMEFLAELHDKKYSTLPFDERSTLLSALLPALSQILVSPNGKAATNIIMTSNTAAAKFNSGGGGGGGGTKEGSKGGGGAKRPRKKKDNTKTSPPIALKETSATSTPATSTPASATSSTPAASTESAKNSSNSTAVDPASKPVPTSNIIESKKKKHSSGLSPSTTVVITPACHIPPCHSIGTSTGPSFLSPTSSSSSFAGAAGASQSSSSSSLSAVNHTIRHMALQLLEHLTLQLLLSTPTTTSSSMTLHSSSSSKSSNSNPATNPFQGDANSIPGEGNTLFRTHAPIIASIAIHVIMEDCEENALLANNRLLVRILRGYNKTSRVRWVAGEGSGGGSCGISSNAGVCSSSSSSSSGGNNYYIRQSTSSMGGVGGREGAKMQRECQALLDFIVDCYRRLGNNGDGGHGGGGGASKKRKGRGGEGGEVNTNVTTSKVLKLTTMATATVKSPLPTEGDVVDNAPVNADTTPQMKSATTDFSVTPPSATTTTTTLAIGIDNNKDKRSSIDATPSLPLPNNNNNNNNDNNCSDIQSIQSFRLLSELPSTIMLLFQLYPIKLASKINMTNLISAMMAFLQNQRLLTSSLLTKTSHGSAVPNTPSAVGNAMTPSLSTPLVVVASCSGKGNSTFVKTSAPVEASVTPMVRNVTTSSKTPTKMEKSSPACNLSQQRQPQQKPLLVVSVLACQIKIVSFITHLLLLSRGNGENIVSSASTPAATTSAAAEATLKLYTESCATYVLQLLRFTSSSTLMMGDVSLTTKSEDGEKGSTVNVCESNRNIGLHHQQLHVIQLRKELLVNTRQLLSTDYRRGFYRHIDAMLDERVLVGSCVNSRLLEQNCGSVTGSSMVATMTHAGGLDVDGDGEGLTARVRREENDNDTRSSTTGLEEYNIIGNGTTSADSFASLQPLGYSILAEFISQVRTKLTPAQLSRTIRIFSRVLHSDLPTSFAYCNGYIIPQSMIPTFTTPHSNMQIAAAKLLVHFPEIIFHNRDPNPQVGRDLLFRILRTCVNKLDVVKSWIPSLMNAADKLGNNAQVVGKLDSYKKHEYSSLLTDVGNLGENDTLMLLPLTIILNLQHLVRPIILGMKTLFWCISSYSHQREKERQRSSLAGEEQYPVPSNHALLGSSNKYSNNFINDEVNSGTMKMTAGERKLVEEFIRVGLPCLRLFSNKIHNLLDAHLHFDDSFNRRRREASSGDNDKRKLNGHREILESFAISLTSLESYNFRKVIAPSLDFMLHQMDTEENNIALFSHLLLTTGKAVSYEFVEVLLGYLIDNIGGFGEYEKTISCSTSLPHTDSKLSPGYPSPPFLTKRAQNLFKLMNLIFSSLLKFPRNENAIVPRLHILVKECIQRSMAESPRGADGVCKSKIELIWPGPYLNTLRALFRTISGGKFDASYKELLPLIPTILNKFYQIYKATHSPTLRHVIIELCLTIPSRLSALLPHLPLLVKVIVPALNSKTGSLINLALRTLEFWCDNLHPDYLHPIFATQDNDGVGHCMLMVALTQHLQPAPYPYGLLCMRLLGKLGGANRLFLREMGVHVDPKGRGEDMMIRNATKRGALSMYCEWRSERSSSDVSHSDKSFLLPFPLRRAVDVLRDVSAAPSINVRDHDIIECASQRLSPTSNTHLNFSQISTIDTRTLDLNLYSVQVMEAVKNNQSKSAFAVLRAALASVLDIDEDGSNGKISFCAKNKTIETNDELFDAASNSDRCCCDSIPRQRKNFTRDFKLICDGLFVASAHDGLENEAMVLLKGLGTHIFYFLISQRANITRIDRDGCLIDTYHTKVDDQPKKGEKYNLQNHISEKLQPLRPFGTFRLSGPSEETDIDPFSFNEALADAFAGTTVQKTRDAATIVMRHLLKLFHDIKSRAEVSRDGDKDIDKDGEMHTDDPPIEETTSEYLAWGDILFESLLSTLCQSCFNQPWNHRTGIMAGLFDLITMMGLSWSEQFEVEILHTAIFVVKDTPDGIAHASKESVRFFLQVSWFFFGGPLSWKDSNEIIYDVLSPTLDDINEQLENSLDGRGIGQISVKEASLTLILSEIASAKPLVRFVVRHVLRLITRDEASIDTLLSPHLSSLKRLVFPKLLRTLPLPNQCAAVDACAFLLDKAPKLIPITDQNLLAFLAELLKMISIADGEFSDPSFGSVVLVDKNGVAANKSGEFSSQNGPTMHASSVFLRKSITVEDSSFGGRIQVPKELPHGVQLRVSTLLLFRGLIRGFADEFFDADPQSKIGNIRPHVVALLFRSLTSEPIEAVDSSASALRNALVLGKEKEDESSISSKSHRLSKELIQSCIRPILLNLRDHTKLSLPLLRGLSRLLGLLSSWFNKTLGEKLLEHLHKFGEPDKIMRLQVFNPGDEPLIAAAVLDLFALLPQASHFVESLVKQSIRLESALPKYKPCRSISPFRDPLAKYLNRHFASAVGFFLEDHRLCNPVYSSLFRDILIREDTVLIRKYLSENSVMLINVCFDRPLQIIRSEKPSAPDGKPTSFPLAMYGINESRSPSAQRKLEAARQDIEMKKKFLALKTQEESRSLKDNQSKSDDKNLLEATDQTAHDVVARAKRELEEARSAYVREVSRAGALSNALEKPMTLHALELQHQGFQIIEILSTLDTQYFLNQHDIIRALRWLWRSRGRHYRLLHEEEIPPRFHGESMTLGKFLVTYSQVNPSDTDILFDLIRIFLHPFSSADFSFIKEYLVKSVSHDVSVQHKLRRTQILERFATLLSSEGSEESKVLSAQMLVIPMLHQTTQQTVFSDNSIQILIDSLLGDRSHGPKLTCELLEIVDVLLGHMQVEYTAAYRLNDLFEFVWTTLKRNNPATKYTSLVPVAKFMSFFDSPSEMVMEFYRSLLSASAESNKVQVALDMLLPVLKTRLRSDELETVLNNTIEMMREFHSITQMVLLWASVVQHPEVFHSRKSEIIPLMVKSLSILGRRSNGPLELKRLTVDLAKLVFDWCAAESSSESASNNQTTNPLDCLSGSTIVNTLVRLAYVSDADKVDQPRQQISWDTLSVLEEFLSLQKSYVVNFAGCFREILQDSNNCDEDGRKSPRSDGSDGVDIAPLLNVGEIVLILLRHYPTNEFLGEPNILLLLNRFFAILPTSTENSRLEHAVEDILVRLLANVHTSREIISFIVSKLEKVLRVDTTYTNSNRSNDLKRIAISVIEKVCKTNPEFIRSFLSSLAALVESLAKQHGQEAMDRATNAMQQMAGNVHQLAATPTLGIYEIACGLGFKPQSLGNDVHTNTGGFKNQVDIVNENPSGSLRILISAIILLGSSNLTFQFSSSRQSFMEALVTILDFSCSLPLLMAAVSIIGKWITVDGMKTPLTKCERENFLWQLCFLDFQRLPELSSQALGDLICCIVLSVYGYSSSIMYEFPFGFVSPISSCDIVKQSRRTKSVINEKSFQKLFVSCSLSMNPCFRSLFMSIMLLQMNDCWLVHHKLSEFASEIGCGEGDSIDVAGIPNRCESHVLLDLLRLDLEILGKRLWTTVFVDTLLASSKHDAGVRLGHVCSNCHIFTSSRKEGPSFLPGYFRLNYDEVRDADYIVDLSDVEYDGGTYAKFTSLIWSQRNENLCGRGRCIAAVRNLIHGDVDTCQSALELCLQSVWQSLPDNGTRASLIKPLENLLAQPFHSQHGKFSGHHQMNSVQSMLRSLVHLRPMPVLEHVLLLSLGENYNVRSEVLCLLECQYISLKGNECDIDLSSHDVNGAVQNIYESLGERDISISISFSRAHLRGTKFALSLDMYDLESESADAYTSLIERAIGNQIDFLPAASEIALWETRWIESHKELGQWSAINEFASFTGDTNLMLECAWKANNWEKVNSLLSLPSVAASLEDGDPTTKLSEIYLAIHSGNFGEVENLHAQTAQLCLHRWRLLPDIGTARDSHKSLLQLYQRLVELRESSQIMVETSSHSARRAIPDLKLLLGAWRHRLPNSFDRVSNWNDVLLWRLNIFDEIASKFAWTNDPNTVATLHDRPFASLVLGRAARKQGLKDVSSFSLNSLSECAMEVEYAFLKLREQVVNCMSSKEHASLEGGLNMINSTNLSFFDSRQKAEMFRLKAIFYQLSNEKPKANQAFCHAVQMCPSYARTWIDWGRLCASLSDEARTNAVDEIADCKELAKRTCLYLVQAMGCFLEAVRCDPSVEQSRDHIPYCLSMLTFDAPLYSNLCRTFETRTVGVPSWVWLPWIPQLLTSLCRVEAKAMKSILVGILKDHPQALYYSLRSFYLERRDIERSSGHKTETSNDEDSLTSSRLAEEFMSNLRKAHPVLWSKLESILEDLIVRFRPSYEAELLNSVVALLQKAIKTAAQVEACRKTLHMLGTKFFNFNKERSESSTTRALFHAKYASLFKSDFLEEADSLDGDHLLAKLHKWKTILERGISQVPKLTNLQEVSPSLSWFSAQSPDLWAGACESKSLSASNAQHDAYSTLDNALYRAKRSSALAATKASSQAVLCTANAEGLSGHSGGGAAAVEIPGQYAPTSSNAMDSRPFPELHAKLARFHQSIQLTDSSTKQYVQQITMIGSDGKSYSFLLQLAIPYWIRTDERSAQVNYVVRKTLRRDFRACRRCLTTRPGVVIPIAQRMRMSAIQSSHDSLDAVFCHVQGPKTSSLTSYFEAKVAEIAASRLIDVQDDTLQVTNNNAMNNIKLEVFQDICETLVLPNVLSRYMSEIISSTEQLYRFRQVFASQLAVNSLLQYAFAIVERTPNRFAFCNVTGEVFSQDFRSQYNHGLIEKLGVPFRLTRSITEFIGPFMLEGVLIPSLTITSSALHSQRSILKPILHLLMRDDVLSWYTSKSSAKNDQKLQEVERQLTDQIWKNVRFVQDCFEECSMREVENAAAEAVSPNPDPIDAKVRSLIDAATCAEKLSLMPAAYHPWL